MDFNLKFHLQNEFEFSFGEHEYSIFNLFEGIPLSVCATIFLDDDTDIGSLSGYLLYNGIDFLYKCDNVSGDCEVIAAVVCKKDGSVNKKYISNDNIFDQIFILDNIEIQENYRNKGIASDIMRNLSQILHQQFDNAGSTIFLCASDYSSANIYGFDSTEYKLGTQKLINFYKKFDYKIISNNVMFWKA